MKNLEKELPNSKQKSQDLTPNSQFVRKYKKRKNLEEELKKDNALRIFFDVCTYFGVKWVDVLKPDRTPKLVKVRQISTYIIKLKTDLPFGKIGDILKIDRTSASRNYSLSKKAHESKRLTETKKDINNILLITF